MWWQVTEAEAWVVECLLHSLYLLLSSDSDLSHFLHMNQVSWKLLPVIKGKEGLQEGCAESHHIHHSNFYSNFIILLIGSLRLVINHYHLNRFILQTKVRLDTVQLSSIGEATLCPVLTWTHASRSFSVRLLWSDCFVLDGVFYQFKLFASDLTNLLRFLPGVCLCSLKEHFFYLLTKWLVAQALSCQCYHRDQILSGPEGCGQQRGSQILIPSTWWKFLSVLINMVQKNLGEAKLREVSV